MSVLPGRNKKHILIIVQNLPVPFDRRVWQEATTLKKAGYKVSVICPKKKMYTNGFEILEGIYIYRYPLIYEADKGVLGYFFEFIYCWIFSFFLSIKIYYNKPFNVIHACNPPDTYFLLSLFYRHLNVKFLFDHHDLSPEMFVAKGKKKNGFLYKCLLYLEKWTFNTADLTIAVNESHKEIAINRGGLNEKRISIVRSGPRSEWATIFERNESLKMGKEHLVMYLGEMCEQDGVEYLIHAIKHYKENYTDNIQFVFVGAGPDKERLSAMSNGLGLNDIAYFTGRVSDAELWQFLSTATVCIDPDPLTEWSNFSTMNKIIEYMAFGCPIIAFDLLENRRSAKDAAIYVSPNNVEELSRTINSLILDKEKRNVMSKFGKERFINSLCWENSAEILIKSYDNLLNIVS